MKKVKIKDIKTGAITEVKASLVDDYLGTGKFVVVEEKKEIKESKPKFNFNGKEE